MKTTKNLKIALCIIGVLCSILFVKCGDIYNKDLLILAGTIIACITIICPVILFIKSNPDIDDTRKKVIFQRAIFGLIVLAFGGYCAIPVITYGGNHEKDLIFLAGFCLALITLFCGFVLLGLSLRGLDIRDMEKRDIENDSNIHGNRFGFQKRKVKLYIHQQIAPLLGAILVIKKHLKLNQKKLKYFFTGIFKFFSYLHIGEKLFNF